MRHRVIRWPLYSTHPFRRCTILSRQSLFPGCAKKGKLNGDIGFQNNAGPTRIRERIDRFRTGGGLDGVATREPRHHVRGLGRSLDGSHLDLPGSLRAGCQTSGAGVQFYSHPNWLGGSRSVSIIFRQWVGSGAYAPFGETYAVSGTPQPLSSATRIAV
jgi:hypothetical protein